MTQPSNWLRTSGHTAVKHTPHSQLRTLPPTQQVDKGKQKVGKKPPSDSAAAEVPCLKEVREASSPSNSKKRKQAIIESSDSDDSDDNERCPVVKKKKAPPPAEPFAHSPMPEPIDVPDNILIEVLDILDPGARYLTCAHNGYEALYQFSRLVPWMIGPYIHIECAFLKGGSLVVQPDIMDKYQPGEKYDADAECAHSYRILADIWPLLIQSEHYLWANPDAAVTLLDFDLSRLWHCVIHFVDPKRTEEFKMKTSQGFKNAFTGRLLCPITKLSKFDADPAVRDWPLILYDETLVVAGKVKPGLFRNASFVQLYQVIYTGPQSGDPELAESSKSTGKTSLAKKYGISKVTPESLCYVATLVRFLLNSQATWSLKDGHLKGAEFVRSLMRVFAQNPKWTKSTLTWWNEYTAG
ncbi:hypothetical protein NUW54_g6263 [Trametes sanguinea]|uniref:Uncharacterized protein n=2 Tax=Trametes sanguinea TaxID=158606 RepID=A0ACC1PKH3_9APHY|nr:hypothetical protein NUW54_g7659 [Trametes sanguinea]KAJ3001700.1 hypothetical protein NUW54_g6263 [Trametes sanguinea]